MTCSQSSTIKVILGLLNNISSANIVKWQISKRVLHENKARQIFRKTSISYPQISTCTCCVSGGKKWSFFGKIGMLCFLVTIVLRFALLLYYRRSGESSMRKLPSRCFPVQSKHWKHQNNVRNLFNDEISVNSEYISHLFPVFYY